MSYANPNIPIIENPKGLDRAIQSIQIDLGEKLTWLHKSFGRAWELKEERTDEDGRTEVVRIPKCYMGDGEYMNVLPNDSLTQVSQSFIAVRGQEKWEGYSNAGHSPLTRPVSIIFWFNLKEINASKDYVFTEELKKDVQEVLKRNPHVMSIDQYFDERVEDVFDGYVPSYRYAAYTINDVQTQYLTYPKAGFRFDVTLGYFEEC